MSFESHESAVDTFPRISEVMIGNMLQIRLMPLAYQARHPEVEMNISDKELRNVMAQEWAESYAQAFRDHIEDNPRDTIDLGNEDALLELLGKIKQYTVH